MFGDGRIQVVHEHPQGRFLDPAFAPQHRSSRRVDLDVTVTGARGGSGPAVSFDLFHILDSGGRTRLLA
jgi:hypothetical protein